jgi:hypothetical protein
MDIISEMVDARQDGGDAHARQKSGGERCITPHPALDNMHNILSMRMLCVR